MLIAPQAYTHSMPFSSSPLPNTRIGAFFDPRFYTNRSVLRPLKYTNRSDGRVNILKVSNLYV